MLKVKKSSLPGAGKGLFTPSDIKKGQIVCEYEGERITWKQAIERNDENKGGYVFFINNNNCIDAFHYKDTFGRFANDAAGVGRIDGFRNNSTYDIVKNKVFIRATRNIEAGSEIFVSYGRAYWNVMREEMKEAAKKKKQKKSKSKKK
ncbi:MAG: SET domain-containing protein-lysine N-methyltransferase [Bacteroidota bacterium]|nr:SET domain-containing protein-lysine N-methyltransferase [Bacteroidota bacterium]